MTSVPTWIVVLVFVIVAGICWTRSVVIGDGNYGLGGCVAALLSLIAALVVLLVHAWGWL
jgi:hypothetical protein